MRPDVNHGDQPLRYMAVTLAAAAFIGLTLASANAADDDDGGNVYTEGLSNFFGSSLRKAEGFVGFGKPPAPPPSATPSGCPLVTILDGTNAQRVSANEAAGGAGLRHQISISDVARECQLTKTEMVLRVGVSGRVLLGPAGSPGTFDVPIRIAIVDRLDERPFLSKLYRVSASIPAGQTAAPYTLVADSLVVKFPAGQNAGDYSIKVGIDTSGGKGEVAKPSRHRKAKPVASAAQ